MRRGEALSTKRITGQRTAAGSIPTPISWSLSRDDAAGVWAVEGRGSRGENRPFPHLLESTADTLPRACYYKSWPDGPSRLHPLAPSAGPRRFLLGMLSRSIER